MPDNPIRYRSQKWYGWRPDTPNPEDEKHRFRAPHIDLPPVVDLRKHMPPVMDQGALGSCTAQAITAALRYLLISTGQPDRQLSRLQLYYDERAVEGTINEDAGAEIRDGIKCAFKLGVGNESLWPYDIARFMEKPPEAVYQEGLKYQGLEYSRVNVSSVAVKTALALGFPVIFGISIFDSFEGEEVQRTGIVPMPDTENEGMVGGHCMIAVGYNQRPETITVRNSWADDWGDQGDCYIPVNIIGSPQFGADYWVIKRVG